MPSAVTPEPSTKADRELRVAWALFGATFVALLLNGMWSLFVGTSSLGGDEGDLVQGWEGVLRNAPAYLLLIVVASLSVWFATRARLHGSPSKVALIATSLVLLFALSSVTRDACEVVMTTRAATAAWVAFGVDAIVVGLIYVAALRTIRRAARR